MTGRVVLTDGAFGYGNGDVFSGLSLSIGPGEVLCLLGPNGCGKTTLLRCLSGSLRLRHGSVFLGDRNIASLPVEEIAKQVGIVHQEHAMLFPYTVLEMVRMGRSAYLGMFSSPSSRDTQIADEALKSVNIAHLRDKPYTQISGGERQLALVARALAQEPEILLLDEPTSHLDFGNQVLVLETVLQLAEQRKMSIIMSTHFPNHALLVASRVAMMRDGRFIALGEPGRVITKDNLRTLYGIDVEVVCLDNGTDDGARVVVPLMRSSRSMRTPVRDEVKEQSGGMPIL